MAYTPIPANLYDYFSTINQRIRKLESAPDQAMDYAVQASTQAVSAQSLALQSYSVATDAQTQAINAGIQAVQAQSQATIASTQATYAVTTANGKNTVSYGTASPPSGTHTTGDLYFQFNGSNQVIAQYTWNGSSWVSNPITSTVIASINAGSIISGTITGIEYNNGSGTFHVTPAGALTASSANITGNIVANTGYFGGYGTTGNYWSIGSSGITGVGTATITGGQINGSSINIGSGTFQVDSSGNLNASSATITGTITTSNLTATGGTIAGFTINSYELTSTNVQILSTGQISTSGQVAANNINVNGASTVPSGGIGVYGGGYFGGSVEVGGNLQIDSYSVVGSPTSANYDTLLISKTSSGAALNRVYAYNNLSSEVYKENITPFADKNYLDIVNQMKPVTFTYKSDMVIDPDSIIMGMIAEDLDAIAGAQDLVEYVNNAPSAIKYDKINLYLIKAIQELSAKIESLKGATNGNGTQSTN